MIFRIGAAVGAIVFVWFASLQTNDPDPVQWIALYGAAAVVSAIGAVRRTPLLLAASVALVAFGWAATLVPDILAEATWNGSEIEREVGGLVLVGAWMLALGSEGRRPA